MENGQYDAAAYMFDILGDYKDCKSRLNWAYYKWARQLVEQQKFDEAINLFTVAGNYSDSKKQITETQYLKAVYLMDNGMPIV